MRTIPRVPVRTVAAGIVSAGLLAGCGIADEGLRPGVAAKVGDETIKVAEVEEAAEQLCDLHAEAAEGAPVSGAEVRRQALQSLVLRAVADGIAEDHGIQPSPSFESLEAEAEELGTVQARQQVGIAYFVTVIDDAARQETGSSAPEELRPAGIEIAQEWAAEEGVKTSSRFPEIEIGDEQVEFARTDLSVPVSDYARAAVTAGEGPQGADQGYAASLPESQRCG